MNFEEKFNYDYNKKDLPPMRLAHKKFFSQILTENSIRQPIVGLNLQVQRITANSDRAVESCLVFTTVELSKLKTQSEVFIFKLLVSRTEIDPSAFTFYQIFFLKLLERRITQHNCV